MFWFFCLAIGLISARLLWPGVAGATPHIAYHYDDRAIALIGHIGCAVTALLVMPFQFSIKLRGSRPWLHRYLGRIYVVACVIAGICGLWLATATQAGLVAAFGFGLLAVIWVYATLQAYLTARARDIARHRGWMIRSGALTFAAVTLRLYLGIGFATGGDFDEVYQLVAWACWVPNLIVAEWWLLDDTAHERAVS
ncbi:DUF2306 domain-containing protein [Loktanella sp. D2R18]|nr:DUF2306 domain-containing protein [Loktanella sp. D2R18]